MQTFIVKLGCFVLFGFIFFSAYQNNRGYASATDAVEHLKPSSVLISTTSDLKRERIPVEALEKREIKELPTGTKSNWTLGSILFIKVTGNK